MQKTNELAYRTLEELDLIDDFMFNQMVSHPIYGKEFARKLLRIILQKEIGEIKVTAQSTYLGDDTKLHGIRMDVEIDETDNAVYDVEPDRRKDQKNILPRRARYYHAKIDSGKLVSGMGYDSLRDVFVIFITSYDPFDRGRMLYTVVSRCEEEPDMEYDDGMRTLYLYTKGNAEGCSETLSKFLKYAENSKSENADTQELRDIDEMLQCVKSDKEVGLSYMKLIELRKEAHDAGVDEGHDTLLISMVCSKVAKGKTLDTIAEELEQEVDALETIYNAVVKCAPNFDVEKVYRELHGSEE